MCTLSISIDNISAFSILITVLGYTVVFVALAVLVIVFVRIRRIQDFFVMKKWKKEKGIDPGLPSKPAETTGDENAAICTALYLYFSELHDEEKYVMTIRKVSRTYSPWSSKLYGTYNALKETR